MKNEESWRLFWLKTKAAAGQIFTVNSPKLTRKRRVPIRLEKCIGGQAQPETLRQKRRTTGESTTRLLIWI